MTLQEKKKKDKKYIWKLFKKIQREKRFINSRLKAIYIIGQGKIFRS